MSGCNRLSCNRCQNHLRARRARAIADRLQKSVDAGKELIYLIPTVPEHRRAACADPKVWSAWLRELWAFLKDELGALYGCQRTDPAGDEDVLKWHPHANFLFVTKSGKGWIDVERVKRKWAEIVGAEFDLTGEPIINVWCWYAGKNDQARVNGWYDYQGRTWPAWRDSVPKHLTVKWYGDRKHFKKEKLPPWTCRDCGAHFIAVRCKHELDADELVEISKARSPNDAVLVAFARGWTNCEPRGEP